MAAQKKYPDELRERAVKMVLEIREREGKGHGELARVAPAGQSVLARAAAGPVLCCERCEHLPGGAEDGEVPVAGVELKLCARYRRGEQPGVPGRDRGVGIAVMDRCRHGDGTELETPGPHQHPQVLGNSPAALAECLAVPG